MFEYNPNLLKSVLLLTLAVSGNFIVSTLGCKAQFYMTNNIYLKHLIVIFIIYFTLSFSSNNENHPLNYMKNSLLIWICYLLFTKQNILFTSISASVLFGTYLLDSFVSYYKKKIEEEKDEIQKNEFKNLKNKLTNVRTFSFYSGIVLIIIGFILYFKKQYTEYKTDFNIIDFILGKVSCNSLQ
jgi:putative effector of murein hydrolase